MILRRSFPKVYELEQLAEKAEIIQQETQRDGWYLFHTNRPAERCSKEEVWGHYQGVLAVEEAFYQLKSHLEVRWQSVTIEQTTISRHVLHAQIWRVILPENRNWEDPRTTGKEGTQMQLALWLQGTLFQDLSYFVFLVFRGFKCRVLQSFQPVSQ